MKKALLSLLLAIVSLPIAFSQEYDGRHVETTSVTACGTYTWAVNGQTYSASTADVVMRGDTIFLLDLTMAEGVVDTLVPIQMNGGCNVKWNKKTWKHAGTFVDTIRTANGCDTVKKITVTLAMRDSSNVTTTACDTFLTAWDSVLRESFTDTLSFVTPEGCVRHDTLKLTLFHSFHAEMEHADTTCSYRWRNKYTITDTLIHYDSLKTAANRGRCDSVYSIKVNLSYLIQKTIDTVVCDKYTSTWNRAYTSSIDTVHNDTNTATKCVTSTALHLTVNNSFKDTVAARANVRDVTGTCFFQWGDSTLTDTTRAIHLATLKTVGNCDSIAAIRIMAYSGVHHDTMTVAACGDQNFGYMWQDTLRTAGTYTVLRQDTATGCDSYHHLNLSIVNVKDTIVTPTHNCVSVNATTRYGITPENANGRTYTFTVADTARAESFTVTPETEVVSGNTYNTVAYNLVTKLTPAGDSIFHINPTNRCRVNYTFNISIKVPAELARANTVDTMACDKFDFLLSTQTFHFDTNSPNIDTVLHAMTGRSRTWNMCRDSVAHLVLNIKHSSNEDTLVVACDEYRWPFNDSTYYATANIARVKKDTAGNALLNDEGCPINGRLLLTVNKTPRVTIDGEWMLQPGDSTTLVAESNIAGVRWDWYIGNSTTPESNHTNTITLRAPENGDGNIDVRLTTTKQYAANNECVANNWLTISSYYNGIEAAETATISIYPNPAVRFVNLDCSEAISQVVVFNALGQKIVDRMGNGTAMQLDLGTLAGGQYTMRIVTASGEQLNRKLIVSK